jgi:glutamate 5-kinase
MVSDLSARQESHSSEPGQGLRALAQADRLVIKIGSSLLVEKGRLRQEWLADLAAELARLHRNGTQVLLVSSGAIALGASGLGLETGGRASLADAQAAAGVGQIALAAAWSGALGEHGLTAAQLLLTLGDLEDRRRYLNVAATLQRLLEAGAVPVVNENDSVATEEIRFGDNDRLAARVAQAANADAVILLSDVAGLYDRPPDAPDAVLIRKVEEVTETLIAGASDRSGSGMGRGGMASKLEAARIAAGAGVALAIMDGRPNGPLARAFATGEGTLFLPRARAGARKGWLSGRLAAAGSIRVDPGCAKALAGGASLLAVGIAGVEGAFARGDLVRIVADGAEIGQGLCEYDADEVRAIAGLRHDLQSEALGYAPRAAVIHRDQLALR